MPSNTWDANVTVHDDSAARATLAALKTLGFSGCLLNANLPCGNPERAKSQIGSLHRRLSKLCGEVDDLDTRTRVTVPIEAKTDTHILNHPDLLLFDVVCVQPMGEAALAALLAQEGDLFDMITVDLSKPTVPFRVSPAQSVQLKRSKVMVELAFAGALGKGVGAATRQNVIKNARGYTRFATSGHMRKAAPYPNFVLSSGATDDMHVRSPLDMQAVGFLFGMNPSFAAAASSELVALVMKRAQERRTLAGVMLQE